VRSLIAGGCQFLPQAGQDQAGGWRPCGSDVPAAAATSWRVLLFASPRYRAGDHRAAELTGIEPGLSLPVGITGHLIALKLPARDDQSRSQDPARLRALLAIAAPAGLTAAREAAPRKIRGGSSQPGNGWIPGNSLNAQVRRAARFTARSPAMLRYVGCAPAASSSLASGFRRRAAPEDETGHANPGRACQLTFESSR